MRFGFFRRNRATFLKPRRGFQGVMAAATRDAGAGGIDSLDLLQATLDQPEAARLVIGLGADPRALQVATRKARATREAAPGLTDDAKAVIEAVSDRAHLARSDFGVQELLIGLAVADCRARRVLDAHGIDADRLIGLAGS